jgi:hypothetical protein
MILEKEPFVRYNEEKKVDSFTVRLNEEERALLEKCKKVIEQPKDSTALKILAWIGAKVLHEEKTSYILGTVFKNKRKNARIGIVEFED